MSAVRQPRAAWKLFTILLGFVLIGIGAAAIQRVLSVLEAVKPPTPLLFDHGLSALDPQAPASWTNRWCGSCHDDEYKEWTQSRHFSAGSNDNFRAQFVDPLGGRMQWCLNCHVPINPGLDNFPTQEPDGIEEAFQETSPHWLKQGVDCLACHVRDGQVLAMRISEEGEQAHPMRLAPELGAAEFCAGCHQFSFKHLEFPDYFKGHLQQASMKEFLEFRANGGTETSCHDCHMEDGDGEVERFGHIMPGGYYLPMLQRAVELELSAKWLDEFQIVQVTVGVSTGHVGHRVPGGEHFFRYFTIHTEFTIDGGDVVTPDKTPVLKRIGDDVKVVTSWPQVIKIGHKLGAFERGDLSAKPTLDTRLSPGDALQFHYFTGIDLKKAKAVVRVRTELRYHVLDDKHASHLGLSPEAITRLVHAKETSLELTGEGRKVQP